MALSLTAMMYVPGSDQSKLAKIDTLGPGSFIIDLEDAVALSMKAQARSRVSNFLNSYTGSQQLWVRVNALETGHMLDDISAVVTPVIIGLVIPKVECARTIYVVEWLLDEFERKAGIESGKIKIMPLIETAIGIASLEDIVKASKRSICLAFGAGDYSLDLGIEWPSASGVMNPLVLAAKVKLAEVSRTYGLLAPHDGAFPDIADKEALFKESKAAYEMGFGGKHAIHPDQVGVIRAGFSPTQKQVDWARKVVAAFVESEASGVAAIQIDGQFVDYPVVYRARQIIALIMENYTRDKQQ